MSKEELFKKMGEIIKNTNGGNDDYVVAICRIGILISDFVEMKEKEIADLEQKLENAIVPKFKESQQVYVACETEILETEYVGESKEHIITVDRARCGWCVDDYNEFRKSQVFATKEEAEQALKE